MSKGIYTIIVIIIASLSSCTKLLEDDFLEFDGDYVINNLLIEGDSIKLRLLKTNTVNATENIPVSDAVVSLSINGEPRGNLEYLEDSAYYQFNQAVEEESTYRFELALPDNESIVFEQYIPKAQPILNFEHIEGAGTNQEGLLHPAVKVEVPNSENREFFYVNIRLLRNYETDNRTYIIKIEDPILLNEGVPYPVFSNELFTGSSQEVLINYTTGSAGSSNGGSLTATLFPLIIELWTLNEAYYEFIKQNHWYEESRYPIIGSGNQAAISNFSNIEGGYGVAAGYSFVKTDTIFPTGTENFFNR